MHAQFSYFKEDDEQTLRLTTTTSSGHTWTSVKRGTHPVDVATFHGCELNLEAMPLVIELRERIAGLEHALGIVQASYASLADVEADDAWMPTGEWIASEMLKTAQR